MDITLDPKEQKGKTLSLFPEVSSGPTNPKQAETIAQRTHVSLGAQSPGIDMVRSDVIQGNMDRYKEMAKQQRLIQFEDTKLQMANDIVRQSANRAPTQDEVDAVMGLSLAQADAGNTETILEQNFAKLLVNASLSADPEEDVLETTDPEEANRAMDIAEYSIARNTVAQDKLAEITKDLEGYGVFDKAWDFAEQLIPFKTSWNFHDLTEAAPTVAWLTGNNVEEQIAYLHTLPPDEFKEKFGLAIEELRGRNIYDALTFAQAVIAYSSSDKFWLNASDVLDVAGAKITQMGAKVALQGVKTGAAKVMPRIFKRMQGVTKGSAKAIDDIAGATADAGHIPEAADAVVAKNIKEVKLAGLNTKTLHDVEVALPQALSPNKTWLNSTSLPTAAVTRLQDLAVARKGLLKEALTDPRRVERLTPDEVTDAVRGARDSLNDTFKHVQHNVVDVKIANAEDSLSNTYGVTVQFGKPDGSFFKSEAGAKTFARKNINPKTDDFTITQYPGGWAVEVTKNVDETKNVIITPLNRHPENTSSWITGWLRSSNDQVSEFNRIQRGVATMSTEHLGFLTKQLVEPFARMGRKSAKELEDVIAQAQTKLNPTTKKTGVYYNTAGEFEQAFMTQHGRMPSADQVDAYFTYVDLQDFDYTVRNLDVYKQKVTMGIEQFEVGPHKFEGKEITELPLASKSPFRIRVIENGKVTEKIYSKMAATSKMKGIKDKLASGEFKLIQATNGPIDVDGDPVQFIIAKDFKRGRIPVEQFARQEGGHLIYKDGFYVKQANLRTASDGGTSYLGDETLFAARSEADANEFADNYNLVLKLWKTDRAAAVKLINDNMPFSAGDFAKKVHLKQISLDAPIAATRSGQSVDSAVDLSKLYPYLERPLNEHSIGRNITGKFLGERSERLITEVYKEASGTFSDRASAMVRPFEALRSTMGDTIKTQIMHDYIQSSAKSWYNQFAKILDVTKEEMATLGDDILINPVYKSGVRPHEIQVAENTRMSIVNLYRNNTPFTQMMQGYKERAAQSIMGKYGADSKLASFSDLAIDTIKNTPDYLRNIAFHSKLGLFNPKQLFLQASAFTNVVAISPRSGSKASANLPLIAAALRKKDLKMVKEIGERAPGWKADHFAEAVNAYRKSGFDHVAGDVAYRDEITNSVKLTNGTVDKVLNNGTLFFSKGEQVPRRIGYFTAYDEWRIKNPNKVFDRRAEAEVLDRAKLISGNMTRDASSRWQKGWTASMTQFMGYQARMAELMIGKRLTGAERARMFAMNSLLYGVPVGVSSATAIMPWRNAIKEWLAEDGYDYDGNALAEVGMDGLLSTVIDWTTGRDYDISGAFGPNGINTFYDLWNGDAEIRDIFLGASGGIAMDVFNGAAPFIKGVWSSIDLNDDTQYPIDYGAAVLFSNISSVGNLIRAYRISNTGKWMSKNGMITTDADRVDSYVNVLFGVTPQRVSDAFNQMDAIKAIDEHKRKMRSQLIKDYKLALKQDPDRMAAMIADIKTRAMADGFTTRDMTYIVREAFDDTPLDESIAEKYKQKVKDK